jgi:hypothetical protein
VTWKGIVFPILTTGAVYLAMRFLGWAGHPYTFLLACVVASAWYYGTWSGVLALALSCLISPSYLTTWNAQYYYDAGEFVLSALVIIYLNHERLQCSLTLTRERDAMQRQKARAFTDAIDIMSVELADLLTVIVTQSEMSLGDESPELRQIRDAGKRGGRLVAQLQLMALSKKNEL